MTQILVLLPSGGCEDSNHLGLHSVVPCEVSTRAHSDPALMKLNWLQITCSAGRRLRWSPRAAWRTDTRSTWPPWQVPGAGTGGIACILLLFSSIQQPLAALGLLASAQCPGDGRTWGMELRGPHVLIHGGTCKPEETIVTSPSARTDPLGRCSSQGMASGAPTSSA